MIGCTRHTLKTSFYINIALRQRVLRELRSPPRERGAGVGGGAGGIRLGTLRIRVGSEFTEFGIPIPGCQLALNGRHDMLVRVPVRE